MYDGFGDALLQISNWNGEVYLFEVDYSQL